MKKLDKNVLLILIGLIGVPFVVQWLFCLQTPYRYFVANWSAGEILNYVGTSFLGLMVFIQNENLKERNDAAQKEIAQTAAMANELTVLSKIIDYELAKKESVEKQLMEYEEAVSVKNILFSINPDSSVVDIKHLTEIEHNLEDKYKQICETLNIPEQGETDYFSSCIKKTYLDAKDMISAIKKSSNNSENRVNPKELKDIQACLKEQREKMIKEKEKNMLHRREELCRLIRNNELNIREYREIY